ncbi:MAG: bacillithiol system redox-active protein YtxJ [bacterium]
MAHPTRISTKAELDYAFRESEERPVILFKHSLTCPVSTAAYQAYLDFLRVHDVASSLAALVEVQNARDVSNEISARTGIRHESPQALMLRGGRAVWNASHWDISVDSLHEGLERAASTESR